MIATMTHMLAAFLFAPLLPGIINRVKAKVSGRKGGSLLQAYYDIWKLLRKGAVIGRTASWIFAAGPSVNLTAVILAACIIPLGSARPIISFTGDIVLLAYILGVGRFFTVIAALDTGSSFEGMGASRESAFSLLSEIPFLFALTALAIQTGNFSVSSIYGSISSGVWAGGGPVLILVMAAMFIVLLAENCRIPVDDPNTHLELTMIHEVMALDNSGPDLGAITLGSSIKLMIFALLFARVAIPAGGLSPWMVDALCLALVIITACLVGIVESFMARLKLIMVPQLLCVAISLSVVAVLLSLFLG